MKRLLRSVGALLFVLSLAVVPALAENTLQITGWMAGGGGVRVWSDLGNGTLGGTHGAGAFNWKLDTGEATPSSAICSPTTTPTRAGHGNFGAGRVGAAGMRPPGDDRDRSIAPRA